MAILELIRNYLFKGSQLPKQKAKCPRCKAGLTLNMFACPKCGLPIKQLFRITCPNCREPVEPDAKECPKCRKSFLPPERRIYACPICDYHADYYMLSCPACNTKFI